MRKSANGLRKRGDTSDALVGLYIESFIYSNVLALMRWLAYI
jgi:hypothetical protein